MTFHSNKPLITLTTPKPKVVIDIDYAPFYDMLTYMRPANSPAEKEFIGRYIDTIPNITQDGYGNRILRLGKSRTLFSCHTDTVHSKSGKQKIVVDEIQGLIYKDDDQPLGADDCTGVFIMKHLIEAKVPGLYIFHREEEIGGLGSNYIVSKTPTLLQGIDRAIAFDRKRDCSVITHQGWSRCCSDAFGTALAGQLTATYHLDDGGVFTDTANYTDIIPECTNISVGYENEHTKLESQCLTTLDALIPALKEVDWENLPTSRDPDAFDVDEKAWGGGHTSYYPKSSRGYNPPHRESGLDWTTVNKADYDWRDEAEVWEDGIDDWHEAYQMVINDPCLAATLLERAFDYFDECKDDDEEEATVLECNQDELASQYADLAAREDELNDDGINLSDEEKEGYVAWWQRTFNGKV